MYCVLAFKNTYIIFFIIKKFKKKKTDINITQEKIMNSIIEMVENKIKPKPQFINEKISKILSLKKKPGLSKDSLT